MKKTMYESPSMVLIGIPVPQVLCASGELEGLGETNYSGGEDWIEE